MIVLGIHDGHDSGAAIIKNGHIVSAVNEERLNRQKLTHGFPRQSILKVLELANITPDDVDFISIATCLFPNHMILQLFLGPATESYPL